MPSPYKRRGGSVIISLIAAIGKNYQLGLDNKMLWHNKEEFKHFKKTTVGHHLLMGRKTFDSIGRPLPDRTTLILTHDKSLLELYGSKKKSDVFAFSTPAEAMSFAQSRGESELFVAGGGEIFKMLLPMAHRIYLSSMDYDGPADVYFPKFTADEFKVMEEKSCPGFNFRLLERQSGQKA